MVSASIVTAKQSILQSKQIVGTVPKKSESGWKIRKISRYCQSMLKQKELKK
jgi:hypothetical protein